MRIIRERGGFRSPGRFEVYWNRWALAGEVIYSGSDEDSWPWMLHLHLLFLSAFIHIPCQWIPKSKREAWRREWQRWGLSQCDDAVHLHWNEKSTVWWIPWVSKVHQRHEVRCADGAWVPFVGSWEQGKEPDEREEFTFPYHYLLRNWTVQERIATVFVERQSWRPRWFTWTSLFEKSRQSIDVHFSDEVGERTGSWKGGCIGCGWEMLPNETPQQTLRRMESERKFA